VHHKIGIGTAQFGSNYGISNKLGQPTEIEIKKILSHANKLGCHVIDTAASYGNSEILLGRLLPRQHTFRIVTKLHPLKVDNINSKVIKECEFNFDKSLEDMNQSKVYALLAHHANDMLKENGSQLYELIKKKRNAGVVEKIGVSVYDKSQINELLDNYELDLIQIPLNILDQRLVNDGTLERLYESGIEIHVRSSFLQGLLLMPFDEIPDYFRPILSNLHVWKKRLDDNGLSLIEGALSYVSSFPQVTSVIVGVNSLTELQQCVYSSNQHLKFETKDIACDDIKILNPSLWTIKE
jgi:aryl-alcohol dehydrogenase-like predicted oxidoreductase